MTICTKKWECIAQFLSRIIQHPVTWVVLFIIAVIPIVLSLLTGGIGGPDPAFYLMYVGKIAEGYIPYKTIALGYTPLWFYLMYAISAPLGISCYNPDFFYVIHYLFVGSNAFFVYLITKYFSKNKYVSLLSAWLFLLIGMWAYGNLILLEMPCIFWGLLASILILYHKEKSPYCFVVYGLLAAFSFLTKQFGFGYFFLCGILIIFQEKRLSKLILFVLGYILPIALCLIYWGEDFVKVVFSSYGTTSAVEAGQDRSLSTLLLIVSKTLGYYIVRIVPALMGIIFFFKTFIKDRNKWCEWIFCWGGIIGFSMTWMFNEQMHYYIYMIPWGVILISVWLSYSQSWINKCIYVGLVVITMLVSVYYAYGKRVFNGSLTSNLERQYQWYQNVTDELLKYVQPDDVVWLSNSAVFPIYYYGKFYPPNLKDYGYAFGPLALNEEDAFNNLRNSDFVVYSEWSRETCSYLTDSVVNILHKHKTIDVGDGIILYDMRSLAKKEDYIEYSYKKK